jgi:hypothetical protein
MSGPHRRSPGIRSGQADTEAELRMSVRGWIERHDVVLFFVLAYLGVVVDLAIDAAER